MTEITLRTFNYFNHPRLAFSNVRSIRAGLIYFIYTGRNAWHSTWISRYSEGCMHASFPEAAESAERRRTSGTVFSIEELPALWVEVLGGVLAVTEINSANPLAYFSVQPTNPKSNRSVKIQNEHLIFDCSKNNMKLEDLISAFDINSQHWTRRPNPENSIVFVAKQDPDIGYLSISPNKLQKWKSRSYGPRYRLSWVNSPSQISSSAVRRLGRAASKSFPVEKLG